MALIEGTAGEDVLDGTDGDDTVRGFGSKDYIRGEGGNDLIEGGAGDDDIEGGAGNDTIIGGTGAEYMGGGEGDDLFIWSVGDGADYINDVGFGFDTLRFGEGIAAGDIAFSRASGDSIHVTHTPSGVSVLVAGVGDELAINRFELTNGTELTFSLNDTIEVAEPDRTTTGSERAETILGTDGRDTILGLGGDDTIIGNAGNDDLTGDSDSLFDIHGDDNVDAGAGDDVVRTLGGVDTLDGGTGTDRLVVFRDGWGGASFAFDFGAGTLSDGTSFTGFEEAEVEFGDGADTVRGGAGADRLTVGSGDDLV